MADTASGIVSGAAAGASFGPIGMGVGALLGAAGASKSGKAAKKAASATERAAQIEDQRLRDLSVPFLEQAKFALPALRSTIMQNVAKNVGTESPYIKAEHNINLGEIAKGEQAASQASSGYWNRVGDVGRGRGEQLRIAQAATETRNKENLTYGGTRETARQTALSQFVNALSGLASQGQAGMQPAMMGAQAAYQGATQAALLRQQGSNEMANLFSGTGGQLFGSGMDYWLKKKYGKG